MRGHAFERLLFLKTPFRIVSLLVPVTSRARLRHSCVSPLHLAAEHNRHAAAAALLGAGADVNATLGPSRSLLYADCRATALCFAVANGGTETAEVLLNAGASMTLDPVSPLLVAVRQGSVGSVSLLLERGADANTRVPPLTTFPTAVALCKNNLPLLKCLLDNGCDAISCFTCTHGSAPHPRTEESRSGDVGHVLHNMSCSEPPGTPLQVRRRTNVTSSARDSSAISLFSSACSVLRVDLGGRHASVGGAGPGSAAGARGSSPAVQQAPGAAGQPGRMARREDKVT